MISELPISQKAKEWENPRMDIYSIRRRNLEILIREHGGKVVALSDATGAPQSYISALRKPRAGRKGMGRDLAETLEKGTGKPLGWMDRDHPEFDNIDPGLHNLGNVTHIDAKVRRVPVISWVQAGEWSETIDMMEPGYAEDWTTFQKPLGDHAFALRVEGDSMEPEFPRGHTIIVDPSREAISGTYVVAKVNGTATFKQLIIDAGVNYLRPVNKDYKPFVMPEGAEIVGVVVHGGKDY